MNKRARKLVKTDPQLATTLTSYANEDRHQLVDLLSDPIYNFHCTVCDQTILTHLEQASETRVHAAEGKHAEKKS